MNPPEPPTHHLAEQENRDAWVAGRGPYDGPGGDEDSTFDPRDVLKRVMPTNRCDSCGTSNLDADSGLCGGCADDLWDAARYYDIGDDE